MEVVKHILVDSSKKIHGWYQGKRECTSERILLNPYNGCEVGCFFCYALSYPGKFQFFRKEGIITVYKNFHQEIEKQIDRLNIIFCGYLSPVSEPFQSIEKKYKLSEKIIEIFVSRNIPIEFITKEEIPESVIEKISIQKHSFGQVSILTPDEEIRKKLMVKGAETEKLFKNIERMAKKNIFSVCRIDPILPFITDKEEKISLIIKKAKDNGVKHIIGSVLDIPENIKEDVLKKIEENFGKEIKEKYIKLYTEKIGRWYNADINYRKYIFSKVREICDKLKISFSLCMEYEIINGTAVGLNRIFSNSINCEGIDIPVYKRKGNYFFPATTCLGNCLNCLENKCGIPNLNQGRTKAYYKGWKYSDYLKWSKLIK